MNGTTALVFARCAGFAFRAPGFSHPSVPPPVRAALALFLTIGLASGVRGAVAPPGGVAFALALATEFLLGSTIGLVANAVYDAAYAGGRIVDDYTGVKAFAPSAQLVAPSGFGRIWSLAFTGGFFLTGAYRPTLEAFAQSFVRIAPGAVAPAGAWAQFALSEIATIVAVALSVAAPAIALTFVVQLALGALSRAVPRFGSFTLVFPLAFAAALAATLFAVATR